MRREGELEILGADHEGGRGTGEERRERDLGPVEAGAIEDRGDGLRKVVEGVVRSEALWEELLESFGELECGKTEAGTGEDFGTGEKIEACEDLGDITRVGDVVAVEEVNEPVDVDKVSQLVRIADDDERRAALNRRRERDLWIVRLRAIKDSSRQGTIPTYFGAPNDDDGRSSRDHSALVVGREDKGPRGIFFCAGSSDGWQTV